MTARATCSVRAALVAVGLSLAAGCGDDASAGDAAPRRDGATIREDGGPDGRSDGAPSVEAGSADAGGEGAPDAASPRFVLAAPAVVALPFAVAGTVPPEGALELHEVGGAPARAPLVITVDGIDFAVDGSTEPLSAGEVRSLSVRFVGPTAEPRNATGTVVLAADDQMLTVTLGAVLGDPALPGTLAWSSADGVASTTAAFPSAPFPDPSASYDDPSVLLALPDELDPDEGVALVTHLHGHRALLARTVPAQRLVEQLGLSGRDAVLVVPQGPEDAADGNFGKLARDGGFARLARDVVAVLYREGRVRVPRVIDTVLCSHSGGYVATAAIVERGGLPVSAVHLFDSLYGRSDVYAGFARAGGLLRSVYTAGGGTIDQNRALSAELVGSGLTVEDVFDDDALATSRVTIGFSESSHDGCIRDERAYARWLVASGLPRRRGAPPELRVTEATGSESTVRWRGELGPFDGRWRVEGSDDGASWETLAETGDTTATVAPRGRLRVRALATDGTESDPSDVYGATGRAWLVVDGFDRVLDGSWRRPTHDFAARVGAALGVPFSVASNEAVAHGDVELGAFPAVLWLLGDESSGDRTFDATERARIEAFVATGGRLVVSGSEVGFATDRAWLASTLGARYVADDAGTTSVESWTLGVVYEEDYPDVLDGDEVLWRYATGGGAAVGRDGRTVVTGFALETMSDGDLAAALGALRGWLGV